MTFRIQGGLGGGLGRGLGGALGGSLGEGDGGVSKGDFKQNRRGLSGQVQDNLSTCIYFLLRQKI